MVKHSHGHLGFCSLIHGLTMCFFTVVFLRIREICQWFLTYAVTETAKPEILAYTGRWRPERINRA